MVNIEKYLKDQIKDFYKLVEVIPNSNGTHVIKYIGLSYGIDRTPIFGSSSHTLNLTQILRDMAISEILTIKKEKNQLQLDESLLTEEQIEKLDKLRSVQKSFFFNFEILNQCKIEWSNQFKVGDRVNFKGHYGIITYKHQMKSKNTPQEWSVRFNGIEYRYVSGVYLSLNKKEDLSKIEVDKELDKLSTIKLLKMYKKSLKRGRGLGNRKIKRILYDREDVSNREIKKIVNYR
jgi:hypothetical protein